MKVRHLLVGLLAVVLGGGAIGTASAHGARTNVGVGLYVGPPVWGAYWGPGWYPPAYYPPPVVVVQPAEPQVYVEKNEPATEPAQAYWYYCSSVKGYYPYVKECPEGWHKVSPKPEK